MTNVLVPIILGIISAGLVTIAAFTPGWIVLESKPDYSGTGFRSYSGLFYGLFCFFNESCKAYSYVDILNAAKNDQYSTLLKMIEWQIEVMLNIILSILSVAVLWIFWKKDKGQRYVIASIILFIIASILVLVASGKALNGTLQARRTLINEVPYKFTFPFSLVPAGIGGVLEIIASVIVCMIRREVAHSDY